MIEYLFPVHYNIYKNLDVFLMQIYIYFWIDEHSQNKEWENRNTCAFNRNCNRPNGVSFFLIQIQRTGDVYILTDGDFSSTLMLTPAKATLTS